MAIYHINLLGTNHELDDIWVCILTKVPESPQYPREIIDIPISPSSWTIETVIINLLKEVEGLDFDAHEVIFLPTMERLVSPADLLNRLKLVREI